MKKIEILLVSAATLLLGTVLNAAEARIWTSRKGSTLEAELLKSDAATVTLIGTKDKKSIAFKVEDLSLADRQYIVEYGKGDPKILTLGVVGEPEKELKIDPATIVKEKEEKVMLGENAYHVLKSEHFLIAYAGDVKEANFAEAAERLWHGMAFQHMDFRKDWGDKRMMIIVAEDRKVHAATGQWYFEVLKNAGDKKGSQEQALQWDDVGMNTLVLPPDITAKYNVLNVARYFNVKESSTYKKPLPPTLVHTLASTLLQKQTGGLSAIGAEGGFAFFTGHSFYKEIELSGRVETVLAGVEGTDNLQSVQKPGFQGSWGKSLKPLVKKGEIKPDLNTLVKMEFKDMNEGNLALIYSYSAYMQNTPARMCAYAGMVRRISTSHQIPTPEEQATMFGFADVAAFNADWTKFILEGSLK